MVDTYHCVRDKGTSADQWLIGSDLHRVRVRVRVCHPFSQLRGELPSSYARVLVIGVGVESACWRSETCACWRGS